MADEKSENEESLPLVRFHYVKSASYRVIHVDGAIGGVTPSGFIHMSLFSERPPIPRELAFRTNPDGSLGEVIVEETVVRNGFVREMDVDVMFDIGTATNIKEWLERQIEVAKSRMQSEPPKPERQ